MAWYQSILRRAVKPNCKCYITSINGRITAHMDNKQAHTIIILLAVIIFIVIILAQTLRCAFSDWLARSRAIKLKKLHGEREQLCKEISTYPTLRLTSEHIPQQFPSKEAAQAFGERWSRGGADSFSAKAVDVQSCDEDHPRFDKTSISGGILYTYPALFFGMSEAYKDDDAWFLDFNLAKNKWLKDYLEHLRKGLVP